MRFLLRLASFLVLVLGVLVAAVDAIQSVSASQPVLTPLATALMSGGASAQSFVESLERLRAGGLTDTVVRWFLRQPAFAVFFVLALLLWMAGYRRKAIAGRFSV